MSKKTTYTTAQKRSQKFLRAVRLNERRIQVLESEIELQQSRLQLNGVAGGENVNKTMSGDSMEVGFTELYKFCDKLDTDLINYVEERDRALSVIKNLKDQGQYMVTYLRYFQGLSYNQIARILNYSDRTVYNLHKRALSAIFPYLPENYKNVQ